MEQTFEKDTKALGIALFIFMIGSTLLTTLLGFLLLGVGYSEIDSISIATTLGMVTIEVFIVQHYSKKLAYTIPYKVNKETLSLRTFFAFAIATVGLFWGSDIILTYLSSFLSDVMTLTTPSFIPEGNLLANIFSITFGILLAPILEELVFRGLLLGVLKRYGRIFAIVTVSFLFGLLHGNLPQAIPAFCFSIVVCCLTLKADSILPAIVLHIFVNTFSYTMMLTSSEFVSTLLTIVYYALSLIGIVFVILYLCKHKIFRLKDEPHRVMEFFHSWGSITFLILSILSLIFSITIV